MKNANITQKTLRSKIWSTMTKSSKENKSSLYYDVFLFIIIIINTLFTAANSFHSLSKSTLFQDSFQVVTIISIIILTINYLFGLWSCTASKNNNNNNLPSRIKFIFMPMSILELIVILTVVMLGSHANIIFILLIKIFKISTYFGEGDSYSPVQILKRSFINKKEELFITILFSTGLLLLNSFIIFHFEAPLQPEKFDNIVPSISWVFGVLTNISTFEFTPITLVGKVLHIIMTLLGIVIVGLPIGIITGSFIQEIDESKKNETLRKRSNILIKAFNQEQKITLRRLISTLNLSNDRKILDIDFAMSRLEYSQNEIFEASRFSKSLRIRACKQSIKSNYEDNLVLESFPVNTSFGSFIDRQSNIHVISTQSVSDMGIGHFSRLLASSMGANYYSNEFFSSTNLLQEQQINFASNELYRIMETNNTPKPLLDWINVLKNNIHPNDLVIYLGTCGMKRDPYYHILCGGEKGEKEFSKIINPTTSNIDGITSLFKDLSTKMKEFKMPIAAHSEFGNTNKNNLTQVIREKKDADIVTIFVNQKLLQFTPLDIYYQSIKILADSIEKNLMQKFETVKQTV